MSDTVPQLQCCHSPGPGVPASCLPAAEPDGLQGFRHHHPGWQPERWRPVAAAAAAAAATAARCQSALQCNHAWHPNWSCSGCHGGRPKGAMAGQCDDTSSSSGAPRPWQQQQQRHVYGRRFLERRCGCAWWGHRVQEEQHCGVCRPVAAAAGTDPSQHYYRGAMA